MENTWAGDIVFDELLLISASIEPAFNIIGYEGLWADGELFQYRRILLKQYQVGMKLMIQVLYWEKSFIV